MPTEVEAKFRANDEGPLVALAAVPTLDGARLGPARVVDEVDRYLDTDDGRLATARWACRLRTRDGITIVSLKGPPVADPGDGVHRRPEIEGPATPATDPVAWPQSDARDLLDSLRGGRRLDETVRLEQRRTERVVTVDGEAVGTLSLDAVTIARAPGDLALLHAVELEVLPGTRGEAALGALVAALASIDGLVADSRSKLEHALERLSPR